MTLEELVKEIKSYEYDLWDLNRIKVTLDSYNYVHLKCPKEHCWISTSECYCFSFIKKIKYKNINNYALVCIEKFKKKLEKENELTIRSHEFNKVIQERV